MKLEDFENLSQNNKLKEKVEQLLNVKDYEKQYRMCQVILEYINVYFLTQKLKIEMKDFDIIRISKEYQKIDEELFNQIVKINALYNMFDENEVNEDDVEELLYDIDYIYGIIKNKHGDIN